MVLLARKTPYVTFALTIQSVLVSISTLIVHREAQGDGEESTEEESPLTRTSGHASTQTRSEEVLKEEAAFCGVSIMQGKRCLFCVI